MSAKQDRAPSLGHAELRLVLFLEDLQRTIETAEQLANAGLEDEAIRIIDLQREALTHLPEQIAADVSTPPKRRFRKLLIASVAAAFTMLASLAGSLGLAGADPMTANEVAQRIASADGISDPSDALDELQVAISGLAALPADHPARADLSRDAALTARRIIDDNDDRETRDPTITEQALEAARAARAQAPPAPASSGSPVDDILKNGL
jgi:hypothetical protein